MDGTTRGSLKALLPGALLLALGVSAGSVSTPVRAGDEKPPVGSPAPATEQRIARLIEQLGAEDFGLRERAQSELSQLGLEAYDALHAAQSHHDPEIALRARYLVRSMSVRWFADSDSPKVVAVLKEYGDLPEEQRRNRIDRLATLENRLGVGPLIRLARFETIEPLAKYAALKILELPPPTEKTELAELSKSIEAIAASSKRTAAGWLRLYAQTLADPAASLAGWSAATKAEHELHAKNPEKSSKEIVRDLYRVHVELLKRLKRSDEAIAVIRRTFSLLDGTPEQVQEIVDWLMTQQAWPTALEVMNQFDATVQENARLLYRLAATYDKLQQPEKAADAAAKALALKPENLEDHILIGITLEYTPGLAKWAENEYRQVLKTATPGSVTEFSARFHLSERLHDRLQELPAAEVLQPVCDLMAKDASAKETCVRARRDPEKVPARMHYLYACHYHEQRDTAKERQHLKSALAADETDADVLIAMHRLPDADEEWKALTRKAIDAAVSGFRAEVTDGRASVDMADSESARQSGLYVLAVACNQYAWLVGNTYGDFEEAVKLSEEAVKISQEVVDLKSHLAGFLDTLGRCQYAAGELVKAVENQSRAAELSPDSGQIRRQLDFFKSEAQAKGIKLPPPAEARAP
jgi:tetratricopeptide (TPR) repeat protein